MLLEEGRPKTVRAGGLELSFMEKRAERISSNMNGRTREEACA
jgi:hypothetical protein